MSLLSVEGVNKSFGGVVAARNLTFRVDDGELVAMIGPNGAGKTTTFNIIGGQLAPDSGTVRLAGEPITGLPPRAIWRRGLSRTFQIAEVFASMSAAENAQMALLSQHGRALSAWTSAAALYRGEALDLVAQVAAGLPPDRAVGEMAYGDIKRVELAVALAGAPKLLLMDEPGAGLGARQRSDLMALTVRLARERRLGVLFTEHDMDMVFGFADRVIVLVQGEIIASGRPEEVRANERVKEAYLGDFGTPGSSTGRGKETPA
jgi:branched-chain amino acid transport system ATP-binding protein